MARRTATIQPRMPMERSFANFATVSGIATWDEVSRDTGCSSVTSLGFPTPGVETGDDPVCFPALAIYPGEFVQSARLFMSFPDMGGTRFVISCILALSGILNMWSQ